MPKWQNLAPPDDPGSWYDVDGAWPTNRGSYETADGFAGTEYTATSAGSPAYAWCGQVVSSTVAQPEFVIDSSRIWQYDPLAANVMTDRTGGVTVGSRPQMAIFGNVIICVMGSPLGAYPGAPLAGVATVAATAGGNFAALAGAPQGQSICVQSGAVGIFNTDTARDGYHFSDVYDHTNWSTGESVSGRLLATPGPILGAVPFANSVFAYKFEGIYRLYYVGGEFKWNTELVWPGMGCCSRNAVAAGTTGMLYASQGRSADDGNLETHYYWFDGASPPVLTNPFTQIPLGRVVYDSIRNIFTVWANGVPYYFDPISFAWGRHTTPGAGSSAIPIEGATAGRRNPSPTTACWTNSATDRLKRWSPTQAADSVCYFETTKRGNEWQKTTFHRACPVLRRRVDLGTDSATCTLTLFSERHASTAVTTRAGIAESAFRNRFDLLDGVAVDNYARVKVAYTGLDVEIDDIKINPPEDEG